MATGYIGDNQCNSRYECLGKHFPALSLYKDVLTGACLSPLGKQFNHVSIATTSLSENSPEACAQFCRQPSLTINGFQVGMQIDDSTCFCLYDGGVPPTSLPSGAVITQKGESYGPVESASGDLNPSIECYPLKDYIYWLVNEIWQNELVFLSAPIGYYFEPRHKMRERNWWTSPWIKNNAGPQRRVPRISVRELIGPRRT